MDTFNKKEKNIISKFLKNGYFIFNIDNKKKLNELKKKILLKSSNLLK